MHTERPPEAENPRRSAVNSALERHRAQFAADPTSIQAFDALEEHLFLAGDWEALVDLYQRRLGAEDLRAKPAVRARVLFRRGQVLEERCGRPDEAQTCFEQAARLAPDFQPALRRLRAAYVRREQWDLALQIAELEADTPMRPAERVTFLVEIGRLWLDRMRDPEQALAQLDRALQDAPRDAGALRGRAEALEALERHADAAATWERLAEVAGGADRAAALVGLANLCEGPLADPERAVALWQRAQEASPEDPELVEAIVASAVAHGRWAVARDVAELRFRVAHGAERRTAVAFETAAILLKRLDDPTGARAWLERARELGADDSRVHLALAEAAARAGDRAAQAASLTRAAALTSGALRARVLVELAGLCTAAGDDATAIEHLRRAFDLAPDRLDVLDALVTAAERAGRHEELADLLESRAARVADDPAEHARALCQLGALHERHTGDVDAALDAFRRGFAADPSAPGALEALERLCAKREAWDELRAVLDVARERTEGDARVAALCSLGELLCGPLSGRAEPGAARAAFEQALALDPRAARGLRGLARVAEASGDEDALLAAWSAEVEASDDGARVASLCAELARRHEARGACDAALGFAERQARLRPDDADALETCARLHERLGHVAVLADTLARLAPLRAGAEGAAVWRRVADLNAAAGRADAALEAWQHALEADPGDVVALRALVEPLRAAGRPDELARVLRQLGERCSGAERAAWLSQLADLLAGSLGDPDSAIVVLWRLVEDADAPPDVDARLEALLERTARFAELAQLLAERRHTLEDGSPEAAELDLRRADLLRERLAQTEPAALLYRQICDANAPGDPRAERALEGLEACARSGGDDAELAWVLARRTDAAADPERRAELRLERARLLEERLDAVDEAIGIYGELAAAGGDAGRRAELLLERALERTGAWGSLRGLLEARVARVEGGDRLALHERLAELCATRLEDPDGVARHLAAAAALAPARADLCERLGTLHERAGRPAEARAALEAALAAGVAPDAEIALRVRVARLCREGLGDEDAADAQLERVIALAPGHAEASALLAGRYERDGRIDELAALLDARLALLEAGGAPAERAALRMRLAELHADRRGDLDAAIAVLEPAVTPATDAPDALASAGEAAVPLAELYARAGRRDPEIALARGMARAASDAAARADWWLRLGGALRARGDAEESIAAHREVLALRPRDPAAEAALRGLLRETNQPEPLARLLEAGLAGLAGADEIPLREELAELLAGPLARPADALVQLRRVLELAPDRADVREQAVHLAGVLDQPELSLQLLDGALLRTTAPAERAALLRRRAALLGGPLGRRAEAVAAWREALAHAPDDDATRNALRAALHEAGDWSGFLDELHTDARQASGSARVALLEEGARIAADQLSPDASLPWLERLRAERPGDPGPLARIAEVHRRAGRPEALLRALEAWIPLAPPGPHRVQLHLERAQVLERELASRPRALAALEDARRESPRDHAPLEQLERLYAALGRPREHAEALEQRLATTPTRDRAPLRRELTALYLDQLGEPARAAEHAAAALAEGAGPRAALLQLQARALRAAGRTLAWVEIAEQELAALDPADPVLADRRRVLHRELAGACLHQLGDADRALAHLRALVDAPPPDSDDALAAAERDAAEASLLDALRARQAHAELELRLARRLARGLGDAAAWVELGRLREERLHAPAAAGEAYAAALACDPGCLDALRGAWRTAEKRADWATAADALERELALRADAPAPERAALLRRIGEVAGQRLLSTTRARRAWSAALELEPDDLASLRALERLCEAMEDWRGALDHYTRERDVLGDGDPARTREVLVRSAALARERLAEPATAIAALEAADRLAPLGLAERRALAELHRERGDLARYTEEFARWCDAPESGARGADHLALARALQDLGQLAPALARVERGLALEPASAALWAAAGELRERLGLRESAAEAFARCANRSPASDAAALLERAARLVEATQPEQALAWLREAVDCDPGSARVHAARARVATARGEHAEAEEAAARALELAAATAGLAREERLAAALVGARAARARGALEAAARFTTTARAVDPSSLEALALEGEVLLAIGELAGARRALEARLAVACDAPDPARPGLLVSLGSALEATGEGEAALARFQEALALDPGSDDARAGVARRHEHAGRLDEALAARLAWAERAAPRCRAEQLTRAAELELARAGDDAAAERHLRAALEADPAHAGAALLLATRLAESGRADEALALVSAADAHANDGGVRARLAILRARLLEVAGDRRAAADAYALAADADPRAASAALARARILRALGEWAAAADGLARFAELHPDAEPAELAQVHFHRARLLAGPLEQLDEGLAAYRAALAANPRLREAHVALAALLVHRPDCFDEALARHRELLVASPAEPGFLRGAVRLAESRGDERGAARGRAILRALGAASPSEREVAPARLDFRVAQAPALENPVWERARLAACAAADEIGRALGTATAANAAPGAAGDRNPSFHGAALAAEARLAAPALAPLATSEVADVLRIVAALVYDAPHVHGDGHRVNALTRELGRRARRRVHRELADVEASEIAEIDFEAWRRELRTLAHADALDAIGGDLRTALVALLEPVAGLAPEPGPEADLSAAVEGSPTALALLRRVVLHWLDGLAAGR
jgi:tetratricopeptide (TPR) repeat protein